MSPSTVQLAQHVPIDPIHAWQLLVAHPELLWGHHAPDLVEGTSYSSMTQHGIGGSGTIQTVADRLVRFSWGEETWSEPAAFVLTVEGGDATELLLAIDGAPTERIASLRRHWAGMLAGFAEFAASRNPDLSAPVRAMLFDADGVLQMPRDGWLERFTAVGGQGFIKAAFTAEVDCLNGSADLAPRLAVLLEGRDATVEDVLAVWHDIAPDADAFALIRRLREAGITCCLATNQQSYRGTHMREVMGTDAHFDRVYYSYEVGHAKPSHAFFQAIVDDLGLPAEQVAFVDDSPPNVIAARELGLRAALHRWATGADGLAADLRAIGVPA